ncbi:uncharacterized protein LOC106168020 [Lingula anatina]|uniref:Uncharacterized protein LOC106168020 n=1 Tax=Lingula anatina TaxID=7574 RepID=A0A1S3IW28_LINAN|nr:uncharacterized protein LOC106168020 [Lingula anatina]XP_013402396.1 uncharacterized protein LOC106168020 [Lingula anatina]|eukprot:XP_013402395.1 uncharacterized protein LOC106168020 [Lingula anatina]
MVRPSLSTVARACRPFLNRTVLKFFTVIAMICIPLSIYLLHVRIEPIQAKRYVKSLPNYAWLIRSGQSSNQTDDKACVYPVLDPYSPEMMAFFEKQSPIQCEIDENWVYIENATFRISESALKKYGPDIECSYRTITRGKTDFEVERGPSVPFKDGDPLKTDFAIVQCYGLLWKKFETILSGISYQPDLHARYKPSMLSNSSMGFNVLMFGFDSVSRMTWIRNLKKSYDYFTKELGGIVLEGYNIVGDGTPQALLPILTGFTEAELPEARRGKPNAKQVDGFPWIWNEFKKLGYVTQWGEDLSGVGTFQYRMLGFNETPTDHNLRPFFLEGENNYEKSNCFGAIPSHVQIINWGKDMFLMYKDKPKFSFLFHSKYSHGYTSKLQVADDDLLGFLQWLEKGRFLDDTILILMADHGARFTSVRDTVQGKLEERMPFFSFRFPKKFIEKYPKAYANVKKNSKVLTTPFDIHETFIDMINHTGTGVADIRRRGVSLFKEIPKSRTCAHAQIEAHWCTCLNWEKVDENVKKVDENVKKAIGSVIRKLNSIIEPQSHLCHELELGNVSQIVRYSGPSETLLKFKQSADNDGRLPDLSDNIAMSEILYQINLSTKPGNGHFEATVHHAVQSGNFIVYDKEISRLNKYGNQPYCVAGKLPHLRAYCYCKEQLST